MRILVTGACGGIGSHLIPRLLDQGHDVLALDDLSSGQWSNLSSHPKLTTFTLDVSDANEIVDFASQNAFDAVYHLAAISSLPECQADPIRAFNVNFLGTVNLVSVARKQPDFKRFIFASTSAVYENTRTSTFSEADHVAPLLVYPQTKYFSEEYLKAEAATSGFPSAIVRIFNVFGDYQNSSRKSPPILNYVVREMLAGRAPVLHGDGEQVRDFIAVDDVVDFFEKLLEFENSPSDIVNLCRGELLSINQIYLAAATALGLSGRPEYAEPGELWAAYPELFQGSLPLNKEYVSKEVSKRSLGSTDKLRAVYNWEPSGMTLDQVAQIALRMKNLLLEHNA